MKPTSVVIVVSLALLSLAVRAQAQSYDSELRLGVEAYRNSRFEEAIHHFSQATELDPSKAEAHLYLATAHSNQFIPGVDTEDNQLIGTNAIEQYQLALDSGDANEGAKRSSVKGIAYLYMNMKKWDEAKTYYQKASALDPNDPEPYYAMGVIDWTRCYQPRMEARARLDMRPEEQLNAKNPEQKRVCDDLRIKNMPTVEDGIEQLNEAIEHRPDYDDAMAYMNLMYRERADLECDDPAARRRDLRTADEWVDTTIATKKIKSARAERGRAPTAPNPQ